MYKAILAQSDRQILPQVVRDLCQRFKDLIDRHESTAPFQFTLPFMAALYHDMLLDEFPEGDFLEPIAKRSQPVPRTDDGAKRGQVGWRYGEPEYNRAKSTSLRAIAFFSWDPESRIFLARRVYPTFFDFLSYSHCPAEWGALGSLLEVVEKDPEEFFKQNVFHEVSHFRQRALPFLEEVSRLQHRAIWSLPIFRGKDILGALLFFLSSPDNQPTRVLLNVHRFRDYLLDSVCNPFASLLEYQETLFGINVAQNLHQLWRKATAKRQEENGKAREKGAQTRILEVTIHTTQGLAQGCAKAVSRLSTYSLRAVLDADKYSPDRKAVLLVAASDPELNIKPDVLRLIGEAFDFESKPVKVYLRWLPCPPTLASKPNN